VQAAIITLVDTSVGSRLFAKATEALAALRAAAVAHQQPSRFNEYLDRLRLSYQPDLVKQSWWRSLMQHGIGPVHEQEVPGARMSRAAAEEYIRMHGVDKVESTGGVELSPALSHLPLCRLCTKDTLCTAGWDVDRQYYYIDRPKNPLLQHSLDTFALYMKPCWV